MPASLSAALVDASPGNAVTLAGTGFGSSGTLVLQNQGVLAPGPLAISTSAWSGTAVTFTVPDGVASAPLVLTAQDGSVATTMLQVSAQYCQASQYSSAIEGTVDNVSALPGDLLSQVLRDASAFVDSAVGYGGLRLLQLQEDHDFRAGRNGRGPRVRPNRGPSRNIPLVSIDAFSVYINGQYSIPFIVSGTTPQIYVNRGAGYAELQGLAIGNIAFGPWSPFVAAGYSPEQIRVTYTAGYGWADTPRAVRKATAIIATELMVEASIIDRGFGGLARVKEGDVLYDRRQESFDLPAPVMKLLKPWTGMAF